MDTQKQDKATYWRAPEYDDMELLNASFKLHRFPLHFHEEYVICVVEKGYHEFFFNGSLQKMQQGDLALINPGEVHGCSGIDEKGWQYRCFYPGVSLMQGLAQEIDDASWQIPNFRYPVIQDKQLAQQLSTLHRAMEHSRTRLVKDTLLREAMGLLLRKHASFNNSRSQHQTDNHAIEIARDYIQSYYADDMSLDDIAHEAGLSPYHLSRIFKEAIGLPPHKYLIQIRIQQAKHLLMSGMPIGDVAVEVGFADQSHLTKWFKRIVGVPPGQFAAY